MSTGWALLVALLLLLGNAFFVGAEFGVVTARRDRLEALAERGVRRARTVVTAQRRLPQVIAGAQLGVTVCSLGLGALAEPAVAGLLELPLRPVGVPPAVLHAAGLVIALIVVSFLHTVLGEMVPKNLTIVGPERSAVLLVPVHYAFCRATAPLLALFTRLSRATLRLVRVEPKDELESAYTPAEFGELIGESRREGLLDDAEHRRLTQTLQSAGQTVADVMVPLAELITVPAGPTIGDVARAVSRTGYSRFPVRAPDGGLLGYLHVKDVLEHAAQPPSTPVPVDRVRVLPEIGSGVRVDEGVAVLRRDRSHLGRVVDDGGSTVGVVAMEDLVEEYVGSVRDATHVSGRPAGGRGGDGAEREPPQGGRSSGAGAAGGDR